MLPTLPIKCMMHDNVVLYFGSHERVIDIVVSVPYNLWLIEITIIFRIDIFTSKNELSYTTKIKVKLKYLW